MIEDILESKAKIIIVKFFCKFPDNVFQMIDVAKRSNLSNSRTSECLRDLARKGILESKKIGKGYQYKLNKSNIFSKLFLKLFREEEKIIENLSQDFVKNIKKISGIESIVLFGSSLKELKMGSDVDFLIVGKRKIDRERISSIETKLIDEYGFHVSTTYMNEIEFKEKAKMGEEFVINMIANGKVIFGKNLEEIVWSEK